MLILFGLLLAVEEPSVSRVDIDPTNRFQNEILYLGFSEQDQNLLKRLCHLKDLESNRLDVIFGFHGGTDSFEQILTSMPAYIGLVHRPSEADTGSAYFQQGVTRTHYYRGQQAVDLVLKELASMARRRLFHDMGRKNIQVQAFENACGPTAISMILQRLGLIVPTDEILSILNVGPKGNPVSLLQLKEFCEGAGLAAEGYRGNEAHLRKLRYPALLHVDGHHFVVLSHLYDQGAVILDPGIGRYFLTPDQLRSRWNGVYLVVQRRP